VLPSDAAVPPPGMSLDQYFLSQVREFQQSFLNATIIQGPTPGTLNGNPAEQLLVTIPYPDGRFKLTEIWTVVGGRAYQIEISLKEGLYTQVSPPHIQKMLESLQLRPVGAVVTAPQQQQGPANNSQNSVAKIFNAPDLGINKMIYPPFFKPDYPSYPPNRVFFRPFDLGKDNVGLMVAVFKGFPLSELVKTYQTNIHQEDLEGALAQGSNTFKGNPAHVFIFNVTASYKNNLATSPNSPPDHLSDYILSTSDQANNSYAITYSASNELFQKYLPLMQAMINSIEFSGQPSTTTNMTTDIGWPCIYVTFSCV
jgi:hypothetical protein